MFAQNGFHATSMNDIAEAAGVTKPVLYQHFASKRDLYLQLLAEVGGELRETIAKATVNASGPRQQIEGGLQAYFLFVEQRGDAYRVLFGSDGPWTDSQKEIAHLRRLTFTPEELAGILGGNAERLLAG